ncbi:MAG: hypothetical protein AAF235_09070, partial [Planctomycetota bacterium]
MRQIMRTMLGGLIDYAGLFPPAGLSMAAAVEEYNRQRLSPDAFALGRFICPASALEDLTKQGQVLMPGTFATSGYREMAQAGMDEPWPVSVTIDTELGEAIAAIDAFNERHNAEDSGLARVTTVELRVASASDIDAAIDGIPKALIPFFEIPLDGDPRGMIAALAGQDGLHAKIRCGGIEAAMIPDISAVASFIMGCAAAGVPFKATAGLHHPIRAERPLTYDSEPPRAVMHGFVNVFFAAAVARARLGGAAELEGVLGETDPAAFT